MSFFRTARLSPISSSLRSPCHEPNEENENHETLNLRSVDGNFAFSLVDGADHNGNLEVGEYYSAILSCENPMMIPKNNDGKPISVF